MTGQIPLSVEPTRKASKVNQASLSASQGLSRPVNQVAFLETDRPTESGLKGKFFVAVSAQGVSQEPTSFPADVAVAAEGDVNILPYPGARVHLDRRAPKPKATLTKEQQSILDTHNKFRAQHGAGPLVWNDKAASFGNNWIKACQFKHSGGRDTKSVGCAKRFCPNSNWTIYICNYEKAGNMVTPNNDFFRKNVLPKQKK
ncbi:hypothetical protein BGZ94_006536 [Podila epigama]|nr:hypothetical protein BGZ94_006536 [Podila epigama]